MTIVAVALVDVDSRVQITEINAGTGVVRESMRVEADEDGRVSRGQQG
jgi:hypothetical protein